jgi:hypothetical protein
MSGRTTRRAMGRLLAIAVLLAVCLHAVHAPHLAEASRVIGESAAGHAGHGATDRGDTSGAHPTTDPDHCVVVTGPPPRGEYAPPAVVTRLSAGPAPAAARRPPVPREAACRSGPTPSRALLQVFLI